MSTFTDQLRLRIGRAVREMKLMKKAKIVNGESSDGDGHRETSRHGAEGHALQVNDPPEQADDVTTTHRHGAEGHVFQVNDPPEQVDDETDDAP